MAGKTTEEPKLKLPSGHPQAGYVSPDRSFRDAGGILPEEDQKAIDEANEAREAEVAAVIEAEHKVVTEEKKAAEGEATSAPTPKTTAKSEPS